MSKERKGFIIEKDGKIYVRIHYTDNLGQRRELMRRANDKPHARQLQKQLIKQLDKEDVEQHLTAERMTFKQLVERYSSYRLIPAQYVGDRKIAGMRSFSDATRRANQLSSHFGNVKIRSITYSMVDQYRLKRLNEGLSIASVNRELSILRAILNYARREGLIDRSPFDTGSPLINAADEIRRERVMSNEEEKRLLEFIASKAEENTAQRNDYLTLRSIVITALDTGCRKGELITLTWGDVDLLNRAIHIKAFHTKTAKARTVPMSERVAEEFERLRIGKTDDDLVFGIADNFKRSWTTALKVAGITGLRFHDLRGTFISRLVSKGMPLEQVCKLSGHTQLSTAYKHYLRTSEDTLDRARELLNQIQNSKLNDLESMPGSGLIN
jgi:integrase